MLFNFLLFSPVLFFLCLCCFRARGEKISDLGMAMDYCRENPIDRIEGIYEFPEDNTVVLIRCAEPRQRMYELIVVSTPDCRLNPGEKIGEMNGTVDPDKFRLALFTSRKNGILSEPNDCTAQFDESDGALRIEKKKLKFSPRLSRFLPKFWRIISLFTIDDPTTKLPQGLIKIFPSPYNGNTLGRTPKYL